MISDFFNFQLSTFNFQLSTSNLQLPTNQLKNTFRNKKIFLTGHTGFKGTWLSIWLQMLGAKVKGYSLEPEKSSLFNKVQSHLKVDSVFADILDESRLKKEIISFQPDFIFHLAAQAIVRESYNNPIVTFDTNVIGTINVLDSLRYLNKKCICVIVTTDKVYENIEKNYAYKETDKLGGYDPYSASKAAAEIVVSSYRLSFFNPEKYLNHKKSIASARAGNVIGGGDFAVDRIIPDIFRALSKNRIINVRNPHAIRPWQHVLEPLNGYLTLAAAMYSNPSKYAQSYNFGPKLKDTSTVKELVNFAIQAWGSGTQKTDRNMKAPHEAGLLMLNINKAGNELGWKPKWSKKKTIEKTINWYKNSLDKKRNVFELCENDILDFTRKKN